MGAAAKKARDRLLLSTNNKSVLTPCKPVKVERFFFMHVFSAGEITESPKKLPDFLGFLRISGEKTDIDYCSAYRYW